MLFAFNTIFPSFVAVLPAPLAYIPILCFPFTLIVPLFIILPVSVVSYPAPIPIEYRGARLPLLSTAEISDSPTVIVPLFVAVPPLIL